jgi:hypothetical protein
MLYIKNVEPTLVFVTAATSHEQLIGYIKTVGTTVFFNNFTQGTLRDYLHINGFKNVSSSVKVLYYAVVDKTILVIHLDGQVLKEKYWVKLSDENLEYVDTYGKENDDFFMSFSTEHMSNNDVYEITTDVPFCEYFVVIMNSDSTSKFPLRRVDLYFKHKTNQYLSVSIFNKKNGFVQIQYENPEPNGDYYFSDFMEFGAGRLLVARIINRHRRINIDITPDSEIVDVNDISIDNFHLFWEKLTPEQLVLLEMTTI